MERSISHLEVWLPDVYRGGARDHAEYRYGQSCPGNKPKWIFALGRKPQNDEQKDRQKNIKLLLDTQRPSVVPKSLLVIHDEENIMKILHERMSVKHEQLSDTGNEKEDVESRINLQPAPDEESFETNSMAFLVLAEEQTGNQKPTEDKKEIHARPSRTRKEWPNVRVMDDYGDDRYTAEDIEPFVSHLLILGWSQKARAKLALGFSGGFFREAVADAVAEGFAVDGFSFQARARGFHYCAHLF